MRSPGVPFHIRGEGNGYLLEIERLRIYIAGDTELIPEMEHLGPIDIAFLPKNLPYTMSDQMFIEAARLIRPAVLYPYHYFEIDRTALQEALPDIKIRLTTVCRSTNRMRRGEEKRFSQHRDAVL